jgi:hypothetical protein
MTAEARAGDERDVIEREVALLDPAVRRDPRRVRALLHPDFTEYGTSGRIWDRDSIAAVTTLRSSVWVRDPAAGWLLRFHQGTVTSQ